jgi:hypothetical protein
MQKKILLFVLLPNLAKRPIDAKGIGKMFFGAASGSLFINVKGGSALVFSSWSQVFS